MQADHMIERGADRLREARPAWRLHRSQRRRDGLLHIDDILVA